MTQLADLFVDRAAAAIMEAGPERYMWPAAGAGDLRALAEILETER